MSFVIAVPEALTMAASDLANIGSTINAANAAAALPTTGVVAAAADEVSAAVAALFGSYAQSYQAFGAQLSAFHAQFVQSLTNGARSYVVAEATSAAPLQDLLGVVNAPAQALLGRPLIGNGANGADGTGPRWAGRAVAWQRREWRIGCAGSARWCWRGCGVDR